MELQGAVQCFSFLKDAGLSIVTFVSDRHQSIAKWIRANQPDTSHFFDICHVTRSLCKKMLQVSKEGGCEVIKEWTKGVRRHILVCNKYQARIQLINSCQVEITYKAHQ